jgi:hypothetical protein
VSPAIMSTCTGERAAQGHPEPSQEEARPPMGREQGLQGPGEGQQDKMVYRLVASLVRQKPQVDCCL